MNKKKRSLRKPKASFGGEGDSGSDEEDMGLNLAPASIIAARKQKKKESALFPGSKSSRGNEGGGGARKLQVGASLHAPPVGTTLAPAGSNVFPTSEDYSVERLREMAKMSSKVYVADDAGVKLSGSFKNAGQGIDDGLHTGFRLAADVLPSQEARHEDVPMMEKEEDSHSIPDDDFIQKAKQKRERIRSNGYDAEPMDYIPLGRREVRNTVVDSFAQNGRFQDDDKVEEEDTAFEEWTQDQIRKGMNSGFLRAQAETEHPKRSTTSQKALSDRNGTMSLSSLDSKTIGQNILENIRSRLHSITLTCNQHANNKKRTEENLATTMDNIQEDESLLKDLSEQFVQAQKIKRYIASLCSMLDEKSAIIEELQFQLIQNKSFRSSAIAERVIFNLNEAVMISSKGVESYMDVLMRGGTEAEAALESDSAIHRAEQDLCDGKHVPVELDEFGRDMNMEKRLKVKDRVLKMNEIFASMDISAVNLSDFKTGESGASASFLKRQQDIEIECRSIFNDTDDDFASIEVIKNRLETWKKDFPRQYEATFMGLSVPALFAPFVRLELLQWDPLDHAPTPLTQLHWYVTLVEYGIHAPETDPDHMVIPSLVKNMVVPYLADLASKVWDPYNLGESRSLSNAIEDIMVYIEDPKEEDIINLMEKVIHKFQNSIQQLQPPSWSPSATSAIPRAKACWKLLFKENLSLFKGICSFRNVLPQESLSDLAFVSLGQSLLTLVRAMIIQHTECSHMLIDLTQALPQDMLVNLGHHSKLSYLLDQIHSISTALLDAHPSDTQVIEVQTAIQSIIGLKS